MDGSLAILRRLSVTQLERIKPQTAKAYDIRCCPMAQATEQTIGSGKDVAYALLDRGAVSFDETRTVRDAAQAFIDRWDTGQITREMLAEAIEKILAEKRDGPMRGYPFCPEHGQQWWRDRHGVAFCSACDPHRVGGNLEMSS